MKQTPIALFDMADIYTEYCSMWKCFWEDEPQKSDEELSLVHTTSEACYASLFRGGSCKEVLQIIETNAPQKMALWFLDEVILPQIPEEVAKSFRIIRDHNMKPLKYGSRVCRVLYDLNQIGGTELFALMTLFRHINEFPGQVKWAYLLNRVCPLKPAAMFYVSSHLGLANNNHSIARVVLHSDADKMRRQIMAARFNRIKYMLNHRWKGENRLRAANTGGFYRSRQLHSIFSLNAGQWGDPKVPSRKDYYLTFDPVTIEIDGLEVHTHTSCKREWEWILAALKGEPVPNAENP